MKQIWLIVVVLVALLGSAASAGASGNSRGDAFWSPPICKPNCENKECGSNGCGGSCGSCEGGLLCAARGSGTACFASEERDEMIIPFKDPKLRDVVAVALGKKKGQHVTVGECSSQLVFLNVNGKGVMFIDGIEYCTSLTDISLNSNFIHDISPLENLHGLTNLILAHNNITDISSLSGLTALTSLDLSYNHISDLSPLNDLPALTILSLSNNYISDIEPLAGMEQLQILELNHQKLGVKPLLEDISALAGLLELKQVYLIGNAITDISPLVVNAENGGLGAGDKVFIFGNPLKAVHFPPNSTYLNILKLKVAGVTLYI